MTDMEYDPYGIQLKNRKKPVNEYIQVKKVPIQETVQNIAERQKPQMMKLA